MNYLNKLKTGISMNDIMGKFERGAGILLHPTSLPSKYGIGELGGKIFDFIDFLADTKQKYWQILPLGPTGYGDSPYQSFSSFAGNPLLLSIELLIEMQIIDESKIDLPEFSSKSVEYGRVISFKDHILKLAYNEFQDSSSHPQDEFSEYKDSQDKWLQQYAVFMTLKANTGLKPWYEWPEQYQNPDNPEIQQFIHDHRDEVDYYQFLQYLFQMQWDAVHTYASQKGISIIGDIPIYVAYDSADTWGNQSLYLMDESGGLKYVSGVPPDYFSATGQLWGNPIYNWEKCEEEGFQFWTKRVSRTLELVDLIRIDHFRGFEAYWQVPAEATTAIDGKWVEGPGESIFKQLRKNLGDLPLIAEDLGVITKPVTELRKSFGMPGMKILQYAFSKSKDSTNGYLPHNYEENTIVYSGTHDNDTSMGWWATAPREIKEHFIQYTDSDQTDIISDMMRLGHSSVADVSMLPMQDLLRKKSSSRMNFPGKAFGNWQWRFDFHELKEDWKSELLEMTETYKRY